MSLQRLELQEKDLQNLASIRHIINKEEFKYKIARELKELFENRLATLVRGVRTALPANIYSQFVANSTTIVYNYILNIDTEFGFENYLCSSLRQNGSTFIPIHVYSTTHGDLEFYFTREKAVGFGATLASALQDPKVLRNTPNYLIDNISDEIDKLIGCISSI